MRVVGVLRGELMLVAAVAFGVALRGYQITGQILAGDEWHALPAACLRGYGAAPPPSCCCHSAPP